MSKVLGIANEAEFVAWFIKEARKRGWVAYRLETIKVCRGVPDIDMYVPTYKEDSIDHMRNFKVEAKYGNAKLSMAQVDWWTKLAKLAINIDDLGCILRYNSGIITMYGGWQITIKDRGDLRAIKNPIYECNMTDSDAVGILFDDFF